MLSERPDPVVDVRIGDRIVYGDRREVEVVDLKHWDSKGRRYVRVFARRDDAEGPVVEASSYALTDRLYGDGRIRRGS